MKYLSLARRYRPQSFDEVVGQKNTIQILKHILERQTVPHAYLFVGGRGVGKTSIARLFAQSLCCSQGGINPCQQCEVCQQINQGALLDFVEIDAASHRKLEHIHLILDDVHHKPLLSQYKIYLIDEAHMLTREAINALLKTLEEPPAHVIFMLATTNAEKLPDTIISRCLLFQLHLLNIEDITAHLDLLLQKEKITCDKKSILENIATCAKGGLRDALNSLEQIIAYSDGKHIREQDMAYVLGHIAEEDCISLIHLLNQGELDKALKMLDQWALLISDEYIINNLLNIVRKIILAQHASLKVDEKIQECAKSIDPNTLQLYYQTLVETKKDMPYTVNSRIALEMCCIRLVYFHPVTTQQVETAKPLEKITPKKIEPVLSLKSSRLKLYKQAVEKPPASVKSIDPPIIKQYNKLETHQDWLMCLEKIKDSMRKRALMQGSLFQHEKNSLITCQLLISIKEEEKRSIEKEMCTILNRPVKINFLESEKVTKMKPVVIHYEVEK